MFTQLISFRSLASTLIAASVLLFSSSAQAQFSLSASKNFFLTEETIQFTISGIDSTTSSDVQVGIFNPSDLPCVTPIGLRYATLKSLSDGKTWKVSAPSDLGNYEGRIYKCSAGVGTVFSKFGFIVGSKPANPGDIQISGTTFLAADTITVTLTGLSAEQIGNSAFAGIYYPTDALDTRAIGGRDVSVSSLRDGKTWNVKAPTDLGVYELRVFTSSKDYGDLGQLLFGKVQFSVISNKAQAGAITISKTTAAPSEELNVSVSGLSNGQIEDGNAFIGLYQPNDLLDANSLTGQRYVSSLRDGKTYTFDAPSTPGVYEVRVYTSSDNAQLSQALYGAVTFLVADTSNPDGYRISTKPKKNISLKRGKSILLNAFIIPKTGGTSISANNIVSFSSLNPKIARVDSFGLIVAGKKGTTKIVIRYGKSSKKVTVTVK